MLALKCAVNKQSAMDVARMGYKLLELHTEGASVLTNTEQSVKDKSLKNVEDAFDVFKENKINVVNVHSPKVNTSLMFDRIIPKDISDRGYADWAIETVFNCDSVSFLLDTIDVYNNKIIELRNSLGIHDIKWNLIIHTRLQSYVWDWLELYKKISSFCNYVFAKYNNVNILFENVMLLDYFAGRKLTNLETGFRAGCDLYDTVHETERVRSMINSEFRDNIGMCLDICHYFVQRQLVEKLGVGNKEYIKLKQLVEMLKEKGLLKSIHLSALNGCGMNIGDENDFKYHGVPIQDCEIPEYVNEIVDMLKTNNELFHISESFITNGDNYNMNMDGIPVVLEIGEEHYPSQVNSKREFEFIREFI